jgi:molybdenum cofactor cytidylyltransferase
VLETYQVEIVNNEDYVSGEMISSVKKGVRSLPNNVEAFLVVLGDQPLIQYSIINILLAKWKETGTAIIHPVYFGKRGHPVLFDISCAGGILSLSSQETLKSFIASNEERLCEVAVEDKAVTVDIDTPEDYEQALSLLQSS